MYWCIGWAHQILKNQTHFGISLYINTSNLVTFLPRWHAAWVWWHCSNSLNYVLAELTGLKETLRKWTSYQLGMLNHQAALMIKLFHFMQWSDFLGNIWVKLKVSLFPNIYIDDLSKLCKCFVFQSPKIWSGKTFVWWMLFSNPLIVIEVAEIYVNNFYEIHFHLVELTLLVIVKYIFIRWYFSGRPLRIEGIGVVSFNSYMFLWNDKEDIYLSQLKPFHQVFNDSLVILNEFIVS